MGAQDRGKYDALHPRVDWAMIEWAVDHHSLIATPYLRELGLDSEAVARRVASGRLHPQYPDVYSVGLPSMTKAACFLGCVWSCGDQAALSHRSSGDLHGVRTDNRFAVDVTVPHNHRGADVEQVEIHRSRHLHPNDLTEIDGIPVTSWARTMVDLASLTAVPDPQLRKALDRSDELELFDLDALTEQFTRAPGRPGTKRLKRILAERTPRHTKSELEELGRRFLVAREIPMPLFNQLLQGETRTVEADMHWPADRLVAQLDGWEFHRTRAQRAADAAADAELELVGLRVIRLIWDDFARQPDRTERRLRLLTPASAAPVRIGGPEATDRP